MAKPSGWWSTHPTLLSLAVPLAWDSNGDGLGDFEGIRIHLGMVRRVKGIFWRNCIE